MTWCNYVLPKSDCVRQLNAPIRILYNVCSVACKWDCCRIFFHVWMWEINHLYFVIKIMALQGGSPCQHFSLRFCWDLVLMAAIPNILNSYLPFFARNICGSGAICSLHAFCGCLVVYFLKPEVLIHFSSSAGFRCVAAQQRHLCEVVSAWERGKEEKNTTIKT